MPTLAHYDHGVVDSSCFHLEPLPYRQTVRIRPKLSRVNVFKLLNVVIRLQDLQTGM